ncbi:MAG TPA: SCE4755 family polysaccharide monooxygenase-like protein [Polyangia bacterium]|nr:SCE4755 family polysaccharide monooxygenase-like protein [Polyangia bacterium]
MRTLALASTIALLGLTSTAEAHFVLMTPLPSNPADSVAPDTSNNASGKGPPPCGPDATPSATPTAVQGGHTLHLDVKETTFHPGHYRIALAGSRAGLPADPNVYDKNMTLLDPTKGNTTSDTATIENPAVFPVLADDVWDHTTPPTKDWTLDLPIPNMNCADCVLQLEQFMSQHPSNIGIGGFFYHHCADLKITADPSMPIFTPGVDGGAPDAATSGSAGATGAAGASGSAGAGGEGGSTSTGSAGSEPAGSGGGAGATSTGASGATGTAGEPAGNAGASGGSTAGSGGATTKSSGGGCSVAAQEMTGTAIPLAILGLGLFATRRRRSDRSR